jgi:apolipoprotein N-acyltransferase
MMRPKFRTWPKAALGGIRRGAPFLLIGLGSATGFAPYGWWPVTIAALGALLWRVSQMPSLRPAMGAGWWFGLGHFLLGLNWIATAFTYQAAMPAWLGWIAVLLLSAYLAVFPAVACGLAWRWGRGDDARLVLAFAAAWIVTEWLRATLFTGFAWNPLAAILADLPTALYARYLGTYGLSGALIAFFGGWLVLLRCWPMPPLRRPGAGLLRAGLLMVLPIVLFMAVPLWSRVVPTGGPLLRIVQPDIAQNEKWDERMEARNFRRLADLTGAPGPEPRLILWPEAAVPEFLEENRFARARLARLLGPGDALLTGGIALLRDEEGYATAAYNSVFAVTPAARLIWRYDKSHLVPYGEYLPMRPILSLFGLSRLAPGDIDFLSGPGPRSFDLPGFGKVGVQICYEIIFSGRVIDTADRPAFLFNPSNDAWFGPSGPPQHLAQARLRAIEEGLPVIRATPTGISAVIDADGRLRATQPPGAAAAIEMRLPPAHAPTPFARTGNILPLGIALAFAIAVVALRRRGR